MAVSYGQQQIVTIRIHKKREQLLEHGSVNLLYPSREDQIKRVREEENRVSQKIDDIKDYSGRYILLDLEDERIMFSDRNLKKVIEHYHELEKQDRSHRRTIFRLTEKRTREIYGNQDRD